MKIKAFFRKPVVITLSILALIALIFLGKTGFTIYMMMSNPRPAPVVSTAVAKPDSWSKTFDAVGSLRSPHGAMLQAEVSGAITEILCQAGQEVKKGDLLLVIDAQSERAAAKLAKLTYERALSLREKKVNTQNDLDEAEAAYEEALADLADKELRAPFDGVVGVPQVYLGDYVTPGTSLVSVEDLSTMNADFWVPQRDVDLLKVGSAVHMHVDAYDDDIFEGTIVGVDSQVDDMTRNVMVRASFDNADGKLRSGMFAALELVLDETVDALVIPSSCVVYSAYGEYVYTVVEDEKMGMSVKQTFVKTAGRVGDFVAIVDGLEEGDEVVSAGQIKLRNGAAITIDNAEAIESSMTPEPSES